MQQNQLYYFRMPEQSTAKRWFAPKRVTSEYLETLDVLRAVEAADLLGVHRSGITRYVSRGILRAYTDGGSGLYVLKAEVAKLKRTRARRAVTVEDGIRKPWKQLRGDRKNHLPLNAK